MTSPFFLVFCVIISLGDIMNYNFKDFQKDVMVRSLSLDKYNYLMNKLYDCDISKDKDFQTKFNAFYRVRRNKKWREVFYSYFEQNKSNKNLTFDEILDYMYKKTKNIEASFCSKLLATINPNMPIWDQYVIKNLNLKVNGKTKKEKLESTKSVYKQIVEIEKEKLVDENIQKSINDFKNFFSEYNLSDIKVLDYFIWSNRDIKED